MTTPSVAEEGLAGTFDLRQLSEANYRRHRLARFLVALGGSLLFVLPIALTVELFYVATPLLLTYGKYFFVAVGVFVGYLCLAIAWLPVRYWARPPVTLSVSSVGLNFEFRSGNWLRVPWTKQGALPIELEERVYPPGVPDEATYSIWVKWGRTDALLIWHRLVPLTYTTAAGFQRVLQEARTQGLTIERFEAARRSSFPTRVRALSGTVYRIARVSA